MYIGFTPPIEFGKDDGKQQLVLGFFISTSIYVLLWPTITGQEVAFRAASEHYWAYGISSLTSAIRMHLKMASSPSTSDLASCRKLK